LEKQENVPPQACENVNQKAMPRGVHESEVQGDGIESLKATWGYANSDANGWAQVGRLALHAIEAGPFTQRSSDDDPKERGSPPQSRSAAKKKRVPITAGSVGKDFPPPPYRPSRFRSGRGKRGQRWKRFRFVFCWGKDGKTMRQPVNPCHGGPPSTVWGGETVPSTSELCVFFFAPEMNNVF